MSACENSESKSHMTTVLLVDYGDVGRVATKWFLNSFGFEVDSACTAEEALALFDTRVHDLIITDHSMPGMSGAELAHVVKLRSPSTPVIMYQARLQTNAIASTASS